MTLLHIAERQKKNEQQSDTSGGGHTYGCKYSCSIRLNDLPVDDNLIEDHVGLLNVEHDLRDI